jgi:hypothetical protein
MPRDHPWHLRYRCILSFFILSHLVITSFASDPVNALDDDHGANPHDDGVSTQIHIVLLLVIGGVSLSMCLETIQHRYHFTFPSWSCNSRCSWCYSWSFYSPHSK